MPIESTSTDNATISANIVDMAITIDIIGPTLAFLVNADTATSATIIPLKAARYVTPCLSASGFILPKTYVKPAKAANIPVKAIITGTRLSLDNALETPCHFDVSLPIAVMLPPIFLIVTTTFLNRIATPIIVPIIATAAAIPAKAFCHPSGKPMKKSLSFLHASANTLS